MNKYFEKFRQLLPKGPIYESEGDEKLYFALSQTFQNVHDWLLQLLIELNPITTTLLLPRWEKILNLPDECSKQSSKTFQARKASVIAKLAYLGQQNIEFYKNLAKKFGNEIEIIEYKPFIAGLSVCGHRLNGEHNVRYCWTIKVKSSDIQKAYFRTSLSQCGEKLLSLTKNTELECRIKSHAQSHTIPIFEYEVKNEI